MINIISCLLNFKNQYKILYIFTSIILLVLFTVNLHNCDVLIIFLYQVVTNYAGPLVIVLKGPVVTNYAGPLVIVLKGPPCLCKNDIS